MEVEVRWKWKVDGSGSTIVTPPNGPNEPPFKHLRTVPISAHAHSIFIIPYSGKFSRGAKFRGSVSFREI